jgi:hypothetical protein
MTFIGVKTLLVEHCRGETFKGFTPTSNHPRGVSCLLWFCPTVLLSLQTWHGEAPGERLHLFTQLANILSIMRCLGMGRKLL